MIRSRFTRGGRSRNLLAPIGTALIATAGFIGSPASIQTAHAASAQDTGAADALFDSGIRLMEEGNFDEACTKFRKSFDLDPGVGTLLNLARCYEQGGRLASSWTTYREASALARTEGQVPREEHARSQAKALEPRLVRIRIDLAEGVVDLPGFKLTQDGTDVVLALVGEAVPVDGGTHKVIASAEGYLDKKIELEATEEGKTYPVAIEGLEKDPNAVVAPAVEEQPADEPTAAPTPQEPPAQTPAEADKRSVGPYVLGAVGLVGLGVGTGFGLKAMGHNNEAEKICTNDDEICTGNEVAKWENEEASFNSSSTIAYVGWGVGAAALAGAVIWYIVDTPSTASDSQAKLRLTPLLGTESWGMSAQGTF